MMIKYFRNELSFSIDEPEFKHFAPLESSIDTRDYWLLFQPLHMDYCLDLRVNAAVERTNANAKQKQSFGRGRAQSTSSCSQGPIYGAGNSVANIVAASRESKRQDDRLRIYRYSSRRQFEGKHTHAHMHVHITRLTGMRIGRQAVWKHISTSMRTYA